jgi:CBS domain-containing protein
MGWFISSLAAGAYRQQMTRSRLADVPVSAIMSTPAVLAPADLSLEEMGHTYFLAGRHTRYPVVQDGRVIGLIDVERASDVPREQWPSTTVAEVASRNLEGVVAAPTASVDSVLSRLEPGGPGAVLVVEDGRLAGIVTRSDVIRFIMDMTRERAVP